MKILNDTDRYSMSMMWFPRPKLDLKVAIVGMGFTGWFHVNAWEKLGTKRLVFCDVNPNVVGNKVADAFYTSYDEMFEKEELDAVSICTPPFNHADIIMKAMKKNLFVAVEKPMVCSVAEAEPIRNYSRLVVLHTQAVESYYMEAWEHVLQGKIGDLCELNVYTMASVEESMTKNPEHWSYKMKGGRMAECLPHPIYISQMFLGDNLEVEYVHVKIFDDRPTFSELTAILRNKDIRSLISIRLNANRDFAVLNAYGSKGSLQAGLTPSFIRVEVGNHSYSPQSIQRFTSRYYLIKNLLDGKSVFSAEHGYQNVRVSDLIMELALHE